MAKICRGYLPWPRVLCFINKRISLILFLVLYDSQLLLHGYHFLRTSVLMHGGLLCITFCLSVWVYGWALLGWLVCPKYRCWPGVLASFPLLAVANSRLLALFPHVQNAEIDGVPVTGLPCGSRTEVASLWASLGYLQVWKSLAGVLTSTSNCFIMDMAWISLGYGSDIEGDGDTLLLNFTLGTIFRTDWSLSLTIVPPILISLLSIFLNFAGPTCSNCL